ARHRALKSMRMHIRHAGDKRARDDVCRALGGRSGFETIDTDDPAVFIDLHKNVIRPSIGEQRLRGENRGHVLYSLKQKSSIKNVYLHLQKAKPCLTRSGSICTPPP